MFPIPPPQHGTQKLPGTFSSAYVQRTALSLAKSLGCSQHNAEKAISGYHSQIRHMLPAEASAKVMQQVRHLADAYGARREISEPALFEAVKVIREKFSFLSVDEIAEAYRQWAAGELDMKKKDAEMYGGQFSAAQAGKILDAYSSNRKKIVGAYLREKQARNEQEAKEQADAKKIAAFDAKFPAIVAKMKSEAKDWRDCPFYIYQAAKDRGLFQIGKEEALEIYADAMSLARMEAENAYEQAQGGGKGFFQLRDLARAVQDEEGIESRAKVIARQITLFRKLCLPASSRPGRDSDIPF